jgi:hypothetical protein
MVRCGGTLEGTAFFRTLETPNMKPTPSRILVTALALGTLGVAFTATTTAAAEEKTVPTGRPYMGYTGTQWAMDYGITRGRCDGKAVAAALAEPAATPGAAAIALIAGLDLDPSDKACAAQALELLRNHRTARWNVGNGAHALTTGGDTVVNGLPCRPFVVSAKGRKILGTACQSQTGLWEVVRP